jgi:membrane protease YdiL (CAAX protease family)
MQSNTTEILFSVNGKYVLLVYLLIQFLFGVVSGAIWPDTSTIQSLEPLSVMISFIIASLLLVKMALDKKVELLNLIGRIPTLKEIKKTMPIIVPLKALSSIGIIWLVYWPLTFISPRFVQSCLSKDSTTFFPNGSLLINAIYFLAIVIIAPIAEEFIFRGLLLTRWSSKWGVKRAVLITSILFGMLHGPTMVSIAFVGFVYALIYIKTRSLIIPILLHAVSNLVAFLVNIYGANDADTSFSVTEFQNEWWIGALGLLIGIPWLIYFIRKNWLNTTLKIPYFENIRLEKDLNANEYTANEGIRDT